MLDLLKESIVLEAAFTKIQKLTVLVLAGMLVLVLILSTLFLGVMIAREIWGPPRFLIPVEGLLDIFGYFLLVLIGVELLETLKTYMKQDVIHVRVVLEVALIAMARKAIILEPSSVPSSTFFGIAALILALGVAFYFERQTQDKPQKDKPEEAPNSVRWMFAEMTAIQPHYLGAMPPAPKT